MKIIFSILIFCAIASQVNSQPSTAPALPPAIPAPAVVNVPNTIQPATPPQAPISAIDDVVLSPPAVDTYDELDNAISPSNVPNSEFPIDGEPPALPPAVPAPLVDSVPSSTTPQWGNPMQPAPYNTIPFVNPYTGPVVAPAVPAPLVDSVPSSTTPQWWWGNPMQPAPYNTIPFMNPMQPAPYNTVPFVNPYTGPVVAPVTPLAVPQVMPQGGPLPSPVENSDSDSQVVELLPVVVVLKSPLTNSAGFLVGISIGGAILVFALGFGLACFVKRYRANKTKATETDGWPKGKGQTCSGDEEEGGQGMEINDIAVKIPNTPVAHYNSGLNAIHWSDAIPVQGVVCAEVVEGVVDTSALMNETNDQKV